MRQKPRSIGDELMPEPEVTLRLAFWLLRRAGVKSHADIAIDGAHVRIAAHEQAGRRIEERTVFDIQSFLTANENVGRRILKGRAFANTGIKIALVSQAGVRLLESRGGERKNE